jgi:hypothetical protein
MDFPEQFGQPGLFIWAQAFADILDEERVDITDSGLGPVVGEHARQRQTYPASPNHDYVHSDSILPMGRLTGQHCF